MVCTVAVNAVLSVCFITSCCDLALAYPARMILKVLLI